MCKCVLKRSTREMREREPVGSLDLLVRSTRMHKGSSRSDVDRTREYIYYWCISGTREEAKERVLYSNKKKKETRECQAIFSFVALSCHREIVPQRWYYYIIIYMMFIATINIILVRFINYTSLYYIYILLSSSLSSCHTHIQRRHIYIYPLITIFNRLFIHLWLSMICIVRLPRSLH